MPYTSVDDIPDSVKQRVKSAKKRRQWLHVWNSSYSRHQDESRAFAEANGVVKKAAKMTDKNSGFNFFLPIEKVDKERRTVSGYASTECLDSDGEVITRKAMEAALPGYWKWRNIREMHQPSAVGTAQEANFDTKGMFLTARIVDDNAWQKCLDGVYKGFSIGGRKLSKSGNKVTKVDLVEISVVDRPANPECKFDVAKSAKVDGAEAFLVPATSTESGSAKAALRKMAEVVDILSHEEVSVVQNLEPTPIQYANLGKSKAKKWAKKLAKRAAKKAQKAQASKSVNMVVEKIETAGSAPPPPLTLGAGGGAEAILGKVKSSHALDLGHVAAMSQRSGNPKRISKRGKNLAAVVGQKTEPSLTLGKVDDRMGHFSLGDFGMTEKTAKTEDLGALLQRLAKTAQAQTSVTKGQNPVDILKNVKVDLKKAREMRQEAEDCVKAAFEMHKAAYLAKQAMGKAKKKDPSNDGDADDFDHGEAMKMLNKAFNALSTQKTFAKAAKDNLAKAASRISSSVGVESGEAGVYDVPAGVSTISPDEMANLPANKGTFITREHAEALVKAGRAEAEAELLKAMPAGPMGGRRPAAFDTTKFGGGNTDNELNKAATTLFKGTNPADLASDNQTTRESALAKAIGNQILSGGGKSIFDPEFHGVGGGAVN